MQLVARKITVNLVQSVLMKPKKLLPSLLTVPVPPWPQTLDSQCYSCRKKQKLLRYPVLPTIELFERFLRTVEPLLSKEEFEDAEEKIYKFNTGKAEYLEILLKKEARESKNWLTERWVRHAYLTFRKPVTVYSSPGMSFPMEKFNSINDFLLYAAKVAFAMMKYKELIDQDKIPVTKLGNNELDNSQFRKIFGTYRKPIYKEDKIEYHPNSRHIIVLYKNHFYKLTMYDRFCNLLHPDVIENELFKIVEAEKNPGIPFGLLTTDLRDNWAVAYEQLEKPIQNRETLNEIESCLFTLSLDKCIDPCGKSELDVLSEQLTHGGGSDCNSANRWMDKTIQLIVNPNGMSGLTYEHSPAEGQAIATMIDFVSCNLNNKKYLKSASQTDYEPAKKLTLTTNKCINQHFLPAIRNIDRLVYNIQFHVLHYKYYGKEFCKQKKLSPDSYIQMALQLAFYKLHKEPTAQYETAHLRIFYSGRTEAIRSCSVESVAFAKAMLCEGLNNAERAKLLRKAVETHREYTVLALQGRGVDRQLFGLKSMAIENNINVPKFYSSKAYVKSSHFRVSTSQVAANNFAFMCYGPAVKDGYACCYNPREDDILLALSCWRNQDTDLMKFAAALKNAFDEMYNVLCEE